MGSFLCIFPEIFRMSSWPPLYSHIALLASSWFNMDHPCNNQSSHSSNVTSLVLSWTFPACYTHSRRRHWRCSRRRWPWFSWCEWHHSQLSRPRNFLCRKAPSRFGIVSERSSPQKTNRLNMFYGYLLFTNVTRLFLHSAMIFWLNLQSTIPPSPY